MLACILSYCKWSYDMIRSHDVFSLSNSFELSFGYFEWSFWIIIRLFWMIILNYHQVILNFHQVILNYYFECDVSTLPSSLPTSLLAASSSLRPVWNKQNDYYDHHHHDHHHHHHHHHLLQPLAQLALHIDDVFHASRQVVDLPTIDLLQHIPASKQSWKRRCNHWNAIFVFFLSESYFWLASSFTVGRLSSLLRT